MSAITTITSISLALNYPTLPSVTHTLINAYKNLLAVSLATEYDFEGSAALKERLANPEAFAAAAPVEAAAETAAEAAPAAAKEEEKEEVRAKFPFALTVSRATMTWASCVQSRESSGLTLTGPLRLSDRRSAEHGPGGRSLSHRLCGQSHVFVCILVSPPSSPRRAEGLARHAVTGDFGPDLRGCARFRCFRLPSILELRLHVGSSSVQPERLVAAAARQSTPAAW